MRRALLALALARMLLLAGAGADGAGAGEARGPVLVAEPAALERYPAAAGARLHCAASGRPAPALAWLQPEGAPLPHDPTRWRDYGNGTLEVLPGGGGELRVRCRATNAYGTVLSRDVTLQPVEEPEWEVELSAAPATEGGVAALACLVRPRGGPGAAGAGDLQPALWYRGQRALQLPPPTPEARMVVAGDTLLVRDVRPADAGDYSCAARHLPTGRTRRSAPKRLQVNAPGEARPAGSGGATAVIATVSAEAGATVCLPCAAFDHPLPHYTWYRERAGRLEAAGEGGEGARGRGRGASGCGAAARRCAWAACPARRPARCCARRSARAGTPRAACACACATRCASRSPRRSRW